MAFMSPTKILDLTIRDLLADTSLEFHKQGSILTFSTPDGVISIQLKGRGAKVATKGTETKATRGPKKGSRPPRPHRPGTRAAELEPKVMALRAEGKTQKEVADILQIKQAYVSILERHAKACIAAGTAAVAEPAPEAETEAPETEAEQQD